MVSERVKTQPLEAYPYVTDIQTRWMDNDIYGHVNNVVYYSFFDTAVNGMLVKEGVLDIHNSDVIGLVIETKCEYFAPIEFPDKLKAGVSISKIGNSSVRYDIGLFKENSQKAVAQGHFVHVYVDRLSRRPTSIPKDLRALLEGLLPVT